MPYQSQYKKMLLLGIFFFVTTGTVRSDEEKLNSEPTSIEQELDFEVQPDFSDELDSMIDQFDDNSFDIKEPSPLVVFLRSIADPVVYYMMKAYNHTINQIHHIRVKILALLARNNNKSLRYSNNR